MRGPKRKWVFTKQEDRFFKDYDGKTATVDSLVALFSARWEKKVPRWVILQRVHHLGLPIRAKCLSKNAKHWSDKDLQWLSDNYGLMPDELICRHLKRSYNSIILAAKRKLNINRKANFYTAWQVAQLLGISCSKIVVWWREKGWLHGEQMTVRCGANHMWGFAEEAVVEALRQRPWLVELKRMQEHYFRSVVKEEWWKDPWHRVDAVAKLMGVKDIYAVHRYIHRGWLPAERQPGGPHQGRWIVRQSTIDAFLANDPRPQHRRGRRLQKGMPVRLHIAWLIICPACKQEVTILAPAGMWGPQVRESFVSLFVDGECSHGIKVDFMVDEPPKVC